jgi:hypothetical protein
VVPGDGRAMRLRTRSAPYTYGEQEITLEYTSREDKTGVLTSEPELASTNVTHVTLEDLEPGTTYWARATWRSTAPILEDYTTTTEWFEFATQPLTDALGTPRVVDGSTTRTGATLTVPVTPGEFARSVQVEYAAPGSPPRRSLAQVVATSSDDPTSTVEVTLDDLAPATRHTVRVVSTVGATEEVSDDLVVVTPKQSAVVGSASVGSVTPSGATLTAPVDAGDLAQQVVAEYAVDSAGVAVQTSAAVAVPAGESDVVAVAVDGLAPRTTFRYRVVATATDGDRVTGPWSTFATTAPAAPRATLTADATQVRAGDRVTLTWTSADATVVTAGDGWSGDLAASGTRTITLDEPGRHRFELVALGSGGRADVQVTVDVALPAVALPVTAEAPVVRAGTSLPLRVAGLAPGEAYTITVAGVPAGAGVADDVGAVSRRVTLPAFLGEGRGRAVVVTGSVADRVGRTTVHVATRKRLTVATRHAVVERGATQRVSVSGLLPGEPVTVTVAGRRVSPADARAGTTGAYAVSFRVTGAKRRTVQQLVAVRGLDATRTGTRTFRIRP